MSFSQDVFIATAKKLGHSQDYIDECISYAENLQIKSLPVIFSTNHLKEILKINNLYYIINNREKYYNFYQIKKRKGNGYRQIVSPNMEMKFIQSFIQTQILNKIKVQDCVNGFVSGKSIFHNAIPHKEANAILNIDLLKFFDSISERRIFGIFRSLGYAKNLSVDLAKLTTVALPQEYLESFSNVEMKAYKRIVRSGEPVLPQGAPTSPLLSNLVLTRMDKRLSSLAEKLDLSYSRYADDITFSGEFEKLPHIKLVARIVKSEGLNVNWDKVGIFKKGRRQLVTGLTISNGIHVQRAFKKEIVKHIHCCIKFGVEEHLKHIKLEEKRYYKEWLLGKISFVKSIEPQTAQKMMHSFNKIIWVI